MGIIGSWWFSSPLLQSIGVNLALELPCLGVEQWLRDSMLLSHGLYTRKRLGKPWILAWSEEEPHMFWSHLERHTCPSTLDVCTSYEEKLTTLHGFAVLVPVLVVSYFLVHLILKIMFKSNI